MAYCSRGSACLGAVKVRRGVYTFTVWAPFAGRADLKLQGTGRAVRLPMKRAGGGYFRAASVRTAPGSTYTYILDGIKERPDPASRFQPEGVHGPSSVVDPDRYVWHDRSWKGLAAGDMILYELHVGTFTPEGTFDAASKKIPYLKKLGITCVEVMPVAQFPGKRNWGYDGVGLYAVQNSYGGPEALKRFIDACHRAGLAVCLDVVYNHLGPEGNYLRDFGPYFTKKYTTPWGDAINYDDRGSAGVRRFIIGNALYWVTEYHVDALRLDAIHGIFDRSRRHILAELNDAVMARARSLGRVVTVIAESDLNDSRVIRPKRQGGYGLPAQWNDDFHHAVHAYLTGERRGYYEDFGGLDDIAKALREGFVYDGKYSPFRKKRHGNTVKDLPPGALVVCVQNHDQVGNRAFGDRLSTLIGFDEEKLAAALLILSPNIPLLFMGQEFGEKAPFLYFVDHGDANLIRAVREGRKREFAGFGWKKTPDPASKRTFLRSRLKWHLGKKGKGEYLLRLYRDLIVLRKKTLSGARLSGVICDRRNRWLAFKYTGSNRGVFAVVVSFLDRTQKIAVPFGAGGFSEILNTASERYRGNIKRRAKTHRKEIVMPRRAAVAGTLSGL